MQTPTMKGTVYILGTSVGDPGFLTDQAVRVLRTAEVVLHDDSVSSEILDLIPASAQVRNVHKFRLQAGNFQEKNHYLLLSAARQSRPVADLKHRAPPRVVR